MQVETLLPLGKLDPGLKQPAQGLDLQELTGGRPVFDLHGWGDPARPMATLSKEGRWEQMPAMITDEIFDTIAVVGTYDQIGERLHERYGGVLDSVEFSVPVASPDDEQVLAALVADLQRT